MAEPTTKQLLEALLAGQQALTDRIEAVENAEPSGVQVEAAKSRGGRKKSSGGTKPNVFTPSAVLRAGWQDAEVGDEVTYTRSGKNPGTSDWTITKVNADGSVEATRR